MRSKKLIGELEDFATFLILAASDAEKERGRECLRDASGRFVAFHEGRSEAYQIAFKKIDGIIKEAKR